MKESEMASPMLDKLMAGGKSEKEKASKKKHVSHIHIHAHKNGVLVQHETDGEPGQGYVGEKPEDGSVFPHSDRPGIVKHVNSLLDKMKGAPEAENAAEDKAEGGKEE